MRWLKRLGLGFLVLVVVAALLWTVSRLRGPTQEQQAALQRMQTQNAFAGRNAFDAVWLLPYDVPDAEIASVADADMAALAATPLLQPMNGVSSARGRYPDLRPDNNAPPKPCSISGAPCLTLVRADAEGYFALVGTNRRLIDRVEALAQYDHLASRVPARADAPLPAFQLLAWPLTAHAVTFAQGDQLTAVDAICRDISTMRRLGANSDLLISRMITARLVTDGYGRLFAAMLSELPADALLPESCEAAVSAPTTAEASICPALRGEFGWARRATEQMAAGETGGWLVFDQNGYEAIAAERIGQGCTDATAEALRVDRRFDPEKRRPFYGRFECIANSAGCMLGDIAGPAYDSYIRGGQDHYARLQLIGTLAWLRAQPTESSLSALLARRPEGLRSPARDITVTADGQSIEIAQYDTSRGATWSLPLPPYLVETPAASD